MQPLKLAVIGCSFLVYDMLMECIKPLPVECAAICGAPEETEKIRRRYNCGKHYGDYREMLEKERPRVVLLFPASGDTFEAAKACLKAGAYVFAERPVCGGSAQAQELIALQKETGCYVMPRYNRRCAPAYMMAKEIIARPEFGRADMFTANYYAGPYASEKAMVWSHFSHIIDAMISLVGDMRLLHADKIVRDEQRAGYNLSFLSESGAIGMVQSGFMLCYEYPMERVEVTGDGRCVIIENMRSLTYHRPAPERKYGGKMILADGGDALCWMQNYGQMTLFSYYGFEGCLEEIVDAAANGGPPSFHMEDAARTIRLLEDIERKAVLHG